MNKSFELNLVMIDIKGSKEDDKIKFNGLIKNFTDGLNTLSLASNNTSTSTENIIVGTSNQSNENNEKTDDVKANTDEDIINDYYSILKLLNHSLLSLTISFKPPIEVNLIENFIHKLNENFFKLHYLINNKSNTLIKEYLIDIFNELHGSLLEYICHHEDFNELQLIFSKVNNHITNTLKLNIRTDLSYLKFKLKYNYDILVDTNNEISKSKDDYDLEHSLVINVSSRFLYLYIAC